MSAPYAKTVMTGNGAGATPAAAAPEPVATATAAAGPAGGDPAGAGPAGAGPAVMGADPAAAGPPPALLAGLGAACISASAVLIKLAGTGTATAAFYRCLLALPVLIALAVLEQRRRGRRPPRARLGALVAGVLLAIDLVLWNHAIADVGAGIATVLGNLQVVFVTAAAWAAFRERPARGFFLALPVVLAGVVLVSGLADGAHGVHSLAGIEYGLGTSVAYAAFLLILRQTSAATPHVAGPLAEATLGAAAGAAALGLAFGGWQLDIGWRSFGWLLLLAMTSQTAGWLLITSSLPKLPAALSSLLLLLQPAASILLAAVVLSERPTPLQLTGAVLVCAGVLAASRAATRPRTPPSSPAPRSAGPAPGYGMPSSIPPTAARDGSDRQATP
jgi:drug/metabolite transporter (DMT)-like permease